MVIPTSSIREVKKHNPALSMLSIHTADGEKVRLLSFVFLKIINTWLGFDILFSFFVCCIVFVSLSMQSASHSTYSTVCCTDTEKHINCTL